MRITILLTSSLLLLGAACTQSTPAPNEAAAQAPKATQTPNGAATYGAALSPGTYISVGEILKDPKAYNGKTVHVAGAVRKACEKKGCWMELAESTTDGSQGCRVTFKDYGFFVPTRSAGAQAKLEGTVEIRTLSKDDVTHMEEEGAHFAKKNADGSAEEVHLVATGVELTHS